MRTIVSARLLQVQRKGELVAWIVVQESRRFCERGSCRLFDEGIWGRGTTHADSQSLLGNMSRIKCFTGCPESLERMQLMASSADNTRYERARLRMN